jgi:adenylosuccinate synthase
MRPAEVVIGAQYGDEGKGLMVDYLSSPDTLVVRFNGGSQAGHTVVTPEGERHVFKSIGAGTYRGASTLLSRFFILNPLAFLEEIQEFPRAIVYVDALARLTTPFDIFLNQEAERARGDKRHGSCGNGINETVERKAFAINVSDILHRPEQVRDVLHAIKDTWVPYRAEQLGIKFSIEEVTSYERRAMHWILGFRDRCKDFLKRVTVVDGDGVLANRHKPVVFEGAQGLRLDEDSSDFPYVTRSKTGLHNVIALARESGVIYELNVHYVTRAYTTRHGAGPLHGEVSGHPYGWQGPETNVDGEWQGRFRYAFLEPDLMKQIIHKDIASAVGTGITVNPSLALTCLDQLPSGAATMVSKFLPQQLALKIGHWSIGPTRNDVLEAVHVNAR